MFDGLRALLVEDHAIVREGLRPLLEGRGIVVVGEAGDGLAAVKLARERKPDLIIMDLMLPRLSGIEATRRIRKILSETKIIILTIHDEPPFIYKALDAGANAYIVTEAPLEELIQAIKAVMAGEVYLSSHFPQTLLESYTKYKKRGKKTDDFAMLTKREREVLQYIAEGYTSRQIAQALYISRKTVENHRANIMEKLDIHEIAGLVRYAIKIGLVE